MKYYTNTFRYFSNKEEVQYWKKSDTNFWILFATKSTSGFMCPVIGYRPQRLRKDQYPSREGTWKRATIAEVMWEML